MPLPQLTCVADYKALRLDLQTQRHAMQTLARRHGLPASELAPFSEGTHLVWGTRQAVLKIFVPLWPEDAVAELAMLELLSDGELPVPHLHATGELDGWPYVVISRMAGRRIGDAWPELTAPQRVQLAAELGAAMAALHATPPPQLPGGPRTRDDLLAERLPKVLDDQRRRGADDALLAQIQQALSDLPPLPDPEPVLVHADLTGDHFLIEDGHLVSVIDFADAFVGPWHYELAAPACFTLTGDPDAQRALMSAYGASNDVADAVRGWSLLHRYAHVATSMERTGFTELQPWLAQLWLD